MNISRIGQLAADSIQAQNPDIGFLRILNLESLSSAVEIQEDRPLLSSFVAQGLLPPGYSLTSRQEELIKNLFQKRALGNEICLIDLLGLEIYDQINNILGAKDIERVNEFRNKFSAFFSLVYLHFMRNPYRDRGAHNPDLKILKSLYGSPNNKAFLRALNLLKLDIQRAVITKQVEIRANQSLKNETKNFLVNSLNQKHTELIAYFDLFLELFQSPHAKTILTDQNLIWFSGSFALENSDKSSLQDLKKYAAYIENLFSAGEERRYFGVVLSETFQKLHVFVKHSLEHISLAETSEFQKELLSYATHLQLTEKHMLQAIQRAQLGTLTHAQWLRENGKVSLSEKTQSDFIETLFQGLAVCKLGSGFLRDIERIAEDLILRERFPGDFLPNEQLKQRISVNGWTIATKSNQLDSSVDESLESFPIQEAIRQELRPVLDLLDRVKQTRFIRNLSKVDNLEAPLLKAPRVQTLPSIEDVNPINLMVLEEFDSHIEDWNRLNSEFPVRLPCLIERLKQVLSENFELGTYTLQDIKDLMFKEMKPFFPLLMLLKDIEQLRGRISPLISEELAQFLVLDGLTIPKPLLKMSSVESIPSLEEIPNSFVEAPLEDLTPLPNLKAPKIELKTSAIEPEFEPEFTFGSRNVREIMAQLKRCGFIQVRQKGSHHTYKMQNPDTKEVDGPSVILPASGRGGELPIGTLRSVEGMVQTAMDSRSRVSKISGPPK